MPLQGILNELRNPSTIYELNNTSRIVVPSGEEYDFTDITNSNEIHVFGVLRSLGKIYNKSGSRICVAGGGIAYIRR